MSPDYSWLTQEMFDKTLEEIYKRDGLPLALVYDIASEHFHSDVFRDLEEERDAQEEEWQKRVDRLADALDYDSAVEKVSFRYSDAWYSGTFGCWVLDAPGSFVHVVPGVRHVSDAETAMRLAEKNLGLED